MIRTINKGKKKIDWYVKWSASIMVLIAIIARASGPEYRDIDMITGTIGICLWLWVSLLWEDRALILLNGVSLFVLITGLIKQFGIL